MLEERLTQKNIAEIKYGKRFGYIFGIVLLCFGLLFGTCFIFISEKTTNWLIIYFASVIFASWLTIFLMNRKYNDDLLFNKKIIETGILRAKREEDNYEAGSGLPAPRALGMRKNICYYFIIGNTEYKVDKDIYTQVEVNEEVNLHYALCSKMLLEITKK